MLVAGKKKDIFPFKHFFFVLLELLLSKTNKANLLKITSF